MFDQLDEYQARAVLTAAVKSRGRAEKAWAGLELASEVLELSALLVSNVTKSQFRPKNTTQEEFTARIKDELGDLQYNVAALAKAFGFTLSEIASANLEKVSGKHKDLKENDHGGEGWGRLPKKPAGTGRLPEKPQDPFPWTKGNKKAIKNCPKCGTETKFQEGCVACQSVGCGWSAC